MQSFIYEYCYQYPPAIFVKPFWWNSLIKRFVNLASGGVYIAPCVTVRAVGSYPAFSTLPLLVAVLSVALSLKSPPPGFLRHPVPKTLGLSSLTDSLRPRDCITLLKVSVLYYMFYVLSRKKEKETEFRSLSLLKGCIFYKSSASCTGFS